MLVAALAGLDRMKAAYEHAKTAGYRFYSYGDCCLIDRVSHTMSAFGFTLLARDGAARRGRVATAHGTIETPVFMRSAPPVRSRA